MEGITEKKIRKINQASVQKSSSKINQANLQKSSSKISGVIPKDLSQKKLHDEYQKKVLDRK